MTKYLDSVINFDIQKAIKDYDRFLQSENAEVVMNNLIVNFSENIGNISKNTPAEVSDDDLTKLLRLYCNNMLKLWNELKTKYASEMFEFNLDNPFKSELEKSDDYLAKLLFN